MLKIIGKKINMITLFINNIEYPCTIIECKPNKIIFIKKNKNNNYSILLGYNKIKEVNKPLKGLFLKYNSYYYKKLIQINNLKNKDIKNLNNKKYIDLKYLRRTKYLDITGKSIGKGFQGVVKRYNFSGVGGKTHGQHNRLRSPGSIGAGSSPSRVFKGLKMSGRMGNVNVTIKKNKIIDIDYKKNLLLIKGSIPGKKNNYLIIKKWKKFL
ncbi:MAG: 50S ribosomal protein L3 [Candidatus Shikimatogenerans bostrichidophilus]|nr:MAG: 50S ribosomal protein L3 [Candidatus Shikimatogenerans bostrichidophilus]